MGGCFYTHITPPPKYATIATFWIRACIYSVVYSVQVAHSSSDVKISAQRTMVRSKPIRNVYQERMRSTVRSCSCAVVYRHRRRRRRSLGHRSAAVDDDRSSCDPGTVNSVSSTSSTISTKSTWFRFKFKAQITIITMTYYNIL